MRSPRRAVLRARQLAGRRCTAAAAASYRRNESDAVPSRLRNPFRAGPKAFLRLGGAASHLSGLALCGSVPRLDSTYARAPGRCKPHGDATPHSPKKASRAGSPGANRVRIGTSAALGQGALRRRLSVLPQWSSWTAATFPCPPAPALPAGAVRRRRRPRPGENPFGERPPTRPRRCRACASASAARSRPWPR